MATTTVMTITVKTAKDLVTDDQIKLVKKINRYVDIVEDLAIGERYGIKGIDVKLADKTD